MNNRIIASIVCFLIGVSLLVVGCNTKHETVPLLRVITVTSNRLNLKGKNNYYIVYENGNVKKTSAFSPSDVTTFYFKGRNDDKNSAILHDLDMDIPQDRAVNDIAQNIVDLVNEEDLELISVNEIFVLDERYFFDILYDAGRSDADCKLFEYIPLENSIKEIVNFRSRSIEHIELYEAQN